MRPTWVDPERLQEGARLSGIAGLTGLDVLRDFALVAGYQASAINRTLILTKALEKGQQRRIAETTKWWVDCTRPGGLARYADGFKSTLQVRLIHALVRRHLRASPEWDQGMYGLPINQGDMQATNLGFSVVYLLAQRALGVIITRAEGAAVMHLWRYIGWLMGVEIVPGCATPRSRGGLPSTRMPSRRRRPTRAAGSWVRRSSTSRSCTSIRTCDGCGGTGTARST